ncbi:MAG: hypothetical protein J5712_06585 [Lachnospiraceae bacterium]|nr:hypothetical protein [Lachnospiraceae bacterium]
MNRIVSRIGALIVTVTVFFFMVFLIIGFTYGSYFVCLFLPIGYIIMAAGLQHESSEERKVAANIGLITAAVYAVFIMLVYYSQLTTVSLEKLDGLTKKVLDYRSGSLMFNYDLLGYGMMALSTFFIGLSMEAETKADKWLRGLLLVHGIFFISCVFMPLTGVFAHMGDGDHYDASPMGGGVIALIIWCIYFLPIGILAFIHFGKKNR